MALVQEHKGELVIVDDWERAYTRPVSIRYYWPLGVKPDEYQRRYIGEEVQGCAGNGLYQSTRYGYFVLPDREKTKPVFVEEKPIKKPRWARVWENGDWRR